MHQLKTKLKLYNSTVLQLTVSSSELAGEERGVGGARRVGGSARRLEGTSLEFREWSVVHDDCRSGLATRAEVCRACRGRSGY